MALELEEIEAIANNPEPATFDNTIAALERAGAALDRVGAPYWVWGGTLSNPEMRAVETAMAPRLSAHSDKILQNAKLFARIEQVYEGRESAGLTPEQQRLTWKRWNAFVRAGAKLEPAAKARVAQINGELAQAFTTFSQNLLADETDYVLYLKTEAELRGLPEDVRAAAAAAATERGRPGEYAILHGPLPDLFRSPRPAREGLADLLQPRGQWRRARQ